MKKILLSCVTCLLALGLVTACDDEVEVVEKDDDTTQENGGDTEEVTPTLGKLVQDGLAFGVEVDGVMNYIDGTTPEKYSYEGNLTTVASEVALCSIYDSNVEGAYFISFEIEEATKWITIIETTNDSGTHINLSYADSAAPLYWNSENEFWGTKDGAYFLCYNSTYKCLYCSAVEDWLATSPVANLVAAPTVVLPTQITLSGPNTVMIGSSIVLTATVDQGEDGIIWSADEQYVTVVNGVVTGVAEAESVTITATSSVAENVSVSTTVSVSGTATTQSITANAIVASGTGEQYTLGDSSNADESCYLSGAITLGNVTTTWTNSAENRDYGTRLWTGDQIRIYKDASFTISVAEGCEIVSVKIETNGSVSSLAVTNADSAVGGNTLVITPSAVDTLEENEAEDLITVSASGTVQMTEILVAYTTTNSDGGNQ